MCGRFTLRASEHELQACCGPVDTTGLDLLPRYNIAPTQRVLIFRLCSAGRVLGWSRWGLIPSWSQGGAAAALINARAETIGEKPSFRAAFRSRRCIVPADGFYEWQEITSKRKQAYYIQPTFSPLMAFAGLWESWTAPGGEVIESCTIITTAANTTMQAFHDRMPVILSADAIESWLNPGTSLDRLQSLLVPCPAEWLITHPVSNAVGSVQHDSPDCIRPITLHELF